MGSIDAMRAIARVVKTVNFANGDREVSGERRSIPPSGFTGTVAMGWILQDSQDSEVIEIVRQAAAEIPATKSR